MNYRGIQIGDSNQAGKGQSENKQSGFLELLEQPVDEGFSLRYEVAGLIGRPFATVIIVDGGPRSMYRQSSMTGNPLGHIEKRVLGSTRHRCIVTTLS